MADATFTGPVDFLVFAFPPGAEIGQGLRAVLDAASSGAIDLLDIECVRVGESGAPVSFPVTELPASADLDGSIFDGVDSEVLEDDDLAEIAAGLEPGGFAVALVYEDRTLASAASAWAGVGGVELLSGGVDMEALARIVGEAQE